MTPRVRQTATETTQPLATPMTILAAPANLLKAPGLPANDLAPATRESLLVRRRRRMARRATH